MIKKKSDSHPTSRRKRPGAKPRRGQAAATLSRKSETRPSRSKRAWQLDLEQRQAELAVINSIQEGLASQLDFQAVVDLVGDKLREVFHTGEIGIRWYEAATDLVHYLYEYEHGVRLNVPPAPPSTKMWQILRDTRQPIVINENIERRQAELGIKIMPGTDQSKSMLNVPMIAGDRMIGSIILEDYVREHAFGDSDVRLVQTVASSMGTALENARLFDETQRLFKAEQQRTAELEIINSIQQGLAAQLDMQAIYDLVGDKIREIFHAQVLVISSYDSVSDLRQFRYLVENGQRLYPEPDRPNAIVREMQQTQQPVLVRTLAEFERYDAGVVAGTVETQSGVYVPLTVGGEFRGYISLQSIERENAFGDADVRLLTTLANSMSVALENARLFEETRRLLAETQQRTAELEIINSVQQGLAAQLDMQAIYDLVGDKIRDIFDAQVVLINIFDHAKRLIHFSYNIEKGQRFYPTPQPFNELAEHLIRTREVVLINEQADERSAEFGMRIVPGTEEPKSLVFVPLIAGGEVKGVVSLQNIDRENAFSESDVRLLTTLTNSMSVALENARLFAETQQRAREQEIIAGVAQMLASQLDMQRIYESVGDTLHDLFNAQVVALSIFDPAENVLHYPYVIEKGERQNAAPQPPSGFTAHVIRTREPLLLHSVTDEIRAAYGSHVIAGSPIKSWLGVPIIIGGAVRGAISLQNVDRENAFTESDMRVLATVALNVGVALENARLFDETKRLLAETQQRTAELEIINSIQAGLAAQLDVQAICDLVGDKMRPLFDAQCLFISSYDAVNDLTQFRYWIENGQLFYPEPTKPGAISRKMQRTLQPVLLRTLAEFERYGTRAIAGTAEARSGIYVPLIAGGEFRGVISLQNVERENAFGEADVRLLTTLANSMSVALENARLFQETRRLLAEMQERAREQEIIASVAQMLASQLDMQRIYESVGDKLRDLFNAQVVTLSTFDPVENMLHYPYMIEKGERQYPASRPPFGFTAHVIRMREPLLLNSVTDETIAAYGSRILAGSPTKSWLGVPIIIGGAVRGVISLQNVDRENAFTESDARVLATVALNVGVALENARLFDETNRLLGETRQRAAEMTTVNRISQALASELELGALIQLVGEQVRQTFSADIVYVALHDRPTNLIHFAYQFGEPMPPLPFGQGLTSRIIKTGEPLLFNKDVAEHYTEMGIALVGIAPKSYLGVPITVGKQAIGVISVQSTQREGRFDESDVRLLTTIAANVGTAIHNARLFEQAQEAQRRLADIVDFLPDATLVIDREGRVIAWNRAIEEMTGIKAPDMIGKGSYEYAIPFYGERRPILIDLVLLPQEEVEQQYANINREGAVLIGETYVSSLKGGGRYLLGTASALRDAKGHIVGAIESIRDITDRKHATEELEKAKMAADSANAAKSAFLATMSHEIRTPMNAIIGMSGLLMDTPLDKEQREYAEIIRNSGDALLTIINDILDFSKIEAGKMELESQPFELRACIESALDLVAPRAAEKGLDLAYLMDDDVPGVIVGDVTRLRQIILNLLTNAVKFTEKGEVVVTVARDAETRGRGDAERVSASARLPVSVSLHFAVRDTGIGIPADRMDRLFQSFSQIDPTTTRRYGGTGLGLAITKRLCEMMGGRIWVESPSRPLPSTRGRPRGPGCTFYFTIAAQPAPDFEAPKRADGAQPQLSGKRLLIVDDNDTNRLIVIRQTHAWGMLTRDTPSPQEALEWITRGDPFDVVIVDMSMPEMDGLTLCAEIRKHEANLAKATEPSQGLPLIICSSLGRREAITEASGVAAILSKPLKQSQLFDALASIFVGPAEQAPAAKPQFDAEMAKRLPLRILLAEDNTTNQKLALRLLQQMGYRADVAGNGLEVIEALARQPYDVVLMDVQMPEMDGLEATRQICQRWMPNERPHIIAMTANAMQGDRELCLAAGMDDYIAKPVRVHELVEALGKCPRHQKGESVTGTNVIDRKVFDDLAASVGGDMAFLGELIDTYLNDATELLAAMRRALADGNVEEFRRAAHSLKSNSANLGAMRLSALAKELEMMAKAGALDGAADTVAGAESEYAQVKVALEQKRK
jgi:PAS domain S-box-containing protein